MPTWLRLSLAGSATLLVGMGLGRFSYSPLIPALIESGTLTAAEAGSVGASNFAGYLIGALAAPLIRKRFGETASVRLCLVLAFLSLLGSALPLGFFWLAFCRALVGGCIGVMMIYAVAIVTRAAPPDRLGVANALVFCGVGVGILCAGTLIPWLLKSGLMYAWVGIAILGGAAALIAIWGWAPADTVTQPGEKAAIIKVEWSSLVLGFVAARTMFSLGMIPHSIYWVDFLVRGLERDIGFGGFHWVLFGLGAIVGTFLWGWLADRIGFRAGLTLAFASLGLGVGLPVLFPVSWILVFSSVVVGAQPGVTALLSGRIHQLLGPERMAPVWRLSALAATVIQAVAGYLFVAVFAMTGSYMPVFLLGAAAMLTGAAISLMLRLPPGREE
jgi:MFS family permease